MAVCYLGVGANLGNRRENIKSALVKINALSCTRILKVAKTIETVPVGGPKGQPKFLNTVLKVDTSLAPRILLRRLKKIEKTLGRKKTVRFGARPIDLDILFYEDKIVNAKDLKIPHPKIFQREFVLKPLSELLEL